MRNGVRNKNRHFKARLVTYVLKSRSQMQAVNIPKNKQREEQFRFHRSVCFRSYRIFKTPLIPVHVRLGDHGVYKGLDRSEGSQFLGKTRSCECRA